MIHISICFSYGRARWWAACSVMVKLSFFFSLLIVSIERQLHAKHYRYVAETIHFSTFIIHIYHFYMFNFLLYFLSISLPHLNISCLWFEFREILVYSLQTNSIMHFFSTFVVVAANTPVNYCFPIQLNAWKLFALSRYKFAKKMQSNWTRNAQFIT